MPRLEWITAAALALMSGTAPAQEPKAPAAGPPAEARIAFSSRSIWNWQVIDNRTVLIETSSHKWYKATLLSNCTDLPFAEKVGFKSNVDDSFDKFSAIQVRSQTCPLVSLTESRAPAKKSSKKPVNAATGVTDLSKP